MIVTRAKVDAALRAEARKFDKAHRGSHIFNAIWQSEDEPGCNWTTSYIVRGSRLPLDEMRGALDRVQARLPSVKFE